ncbi:MAG: hypothetical protein IB618_03160 [Candidatus Pacearchaeota archaeon]|nr:MAG: hypothetical protein IB618_03160 [Candidatus Pacearchaeota archaeon]
MVKGKRIFSVLLIATILITAMFVIGAGCEEETQTNGQTPPSNGQQQQPQIEMLFSDDFSDDNKGSSPDKWTSVMEDKLQASIEGTAQDSGKYGNVVNIKGRILTTGSQSWKDYTISLDFRINTAGKGIGPEIAFYVSGDNKDYYIISSEIEPTGVEYTLYRVSDGSRTQIKKRVDYNKIIDNDEWHSLKLNVKEGKLDIDDQTAFEFEPVTKLTSGAIGLATDPDGSIYYDNIAVIGIK